MDNKGRQNNTQLFLLNQYSHKKGGKKESGAVSGRLRSHSCITKNPCWKYIRCTIFLSTVGDLWNINKHKTQTSLSLISVLNVQVYSGIIT